MADKPKSNGKAVTSTGHTPKAGPKKPGWRPAKKGVQMPQNTMTAGIEQDRIEYQKEAMSILLSETLDSTSPTMRERLLHAGDLFLQTYADTSTKQLEDLRKERFYYALNRATNSLPQGAVRGFFVSAVKAAYRASTGEQTRTIIGSPSMMPLHRTMTLANAS